MNYLLYRNTCQQSLMRNKVERIWLFKIGIGTSGGQKLIGVIMVVRFF